MGEWQYDYWTPTRRELLAELRGAKDRIEGLVLAIQRKHGGPRKLDLSEAGRLARKPFYTAYDEAQRLRMRLLRELKTADEDD
jgi:hypothetical protein